MRHSRLYALAGALLGLGAPAGLLVLRLLQHRGLDEAARDPVLYAYITLGSMGAMAAFAFALGIHEERLVALARVDGLTGLWNRRHFDERLAEETARASRYGTPLSLLIIDLDRFKRVNDQYGHVQGDLVLRLISTLIHDGFRTNDLVCRYGGEEIAVIAPNTREQDAAVFAERTRERIAQTVLPLATAADSRHGPFTITVSIGVAQARPGETPTELIDRADAALYAAKRNGRNRTCLGSEPIGNESRPAM